MITLEINHICISLNFFYYGTVSLTLSENGSVSQDKFQTSLFVSDNSERSRVDLKSCAVIFNSFLIKKM